MRAPVGGAPVATIGAPNQESALDQRVEDDCACLAIQGAQPLGLLVRQLKSWHFHVFGLDSPQEPIVQFIPHGEPFPRTVVK